MSSSLDIHRCSWYTVRVHAYADFFLDVDGPEHLHEEPLGVLQELLDLKVGLQLVELLHLQRNKPWFPCQHSLMNVSLLPLFTLSFSLSLTLIYCYSILPSFLLISRSLPLSSPLALTSSSAAII